MVRIPPKRGPNFGRPKFRDGSRKNSFFTLNQKTTIFCPGQKLQKIFLRKLLFCQRSSWTSGTRLGNFGKFFTYNFPSKSIENIWWLFGLFLKISLLSNNCFGYFLSNFGKHLAYFLFLHLVTLNSRPQIRKSFCEFFGVSLWWWWFIIKF